MRRTRFVRNKEQQSSSSATSASSITSTSDDLDEELLPAKRRKTDNVFLKLTAHERTICGNTMRQYDSISKTNRIELQNKQKIVDLDGGMLRKLSLDAMSSNQQLRALVRRSVMLMFSACGNYLIGYQQMQQHNTFRLEYRHEPFTDDENLVLSFWTFPLDGRQMQLLCEVPLFGTALRSTDLLPREVALQDFAMDSQQGTEDVHGRQVQHVEQTRQKLLNMKHHILEYFGYETHPLLVRVSQSPDQQLLVARVSTGTHHGVFLMPAPTFGLNFEKNLWGLIFQFSSLDSQDVPQLPIEASMLFCTSSQGECLAHSYAYFCIPTPSSIDIVAVSMTSGDVSHQQTSFLRRVPDEDPFVIDIGLEYLRSLARSKLVDLDHGLSEELDTYQLLSHRAPSELNTKFSCVCLCRRQCAHLDIQSLLQQQIKESEKILDFEHRMIRKKNKYGHLQFLIVADVAQATGEDSFERRSIPSKRLTVLVQISMVHAKLAIIKQAWQDISQQSQKKFVSCKQHARVGAQVLEAGTDTQSEDFNFGFTSGSNEAVLLGKSKPFIKNPVFPVVATMEAS